MSGPEYFLVSVPKSVFNLNELLSSTANAGLLARIETRNFEWQNPQSPRVQGSCTAFPIPNLLVGTLNTLMSLSEDLLKLDTACKNVVSNIERQGKDLHQQMYNPESLDNWAFVDSNRSRSNYFMGFQWAEQKYPSGYPLPDLTNLIRNRVSKMEEELKHFQQIYQEKRQEKLTYDRRARGNLMIADLNSVLQVQSTLGNVANIQVAGTKVEATGHALTEHDFTDTQFLKTLVVVVGKGNAKEFEATYTSLDADPTLRKGGNVAADAAETKGEVKDDHPPLRCSPVVPGSLVRVTSDKETVLYLLTVLKSQKITGSHGGIEGWTVADSFYSACRSARVTVRNFSWDPTAAERAREEVAKIDSQYQHYEAKTLDWCKVHYGEAVIAHAHIKAIRVFVESVLRYGLPPQFDTVLLRPRSGREKSLRSVLQRLYGSLDQDAGEDEGPAGVGSDFFPYVSISF